MTTWITICDTCKSDSWDAAAGQMPDGEALADLIEAAALKQGGMGREVKTRRVSCTMGCERACNIIIQGEGKIGYSLGKFVADDDAAQAIVDYAVMHSNSETGQVPFREWPAGVKGHFVSRQVPVPEK